jgi:phospholipase C
MPDVSGTPGEDSAESASSHPTRRRLLGGAAAVTGGVAAAMALPPNVRRAVAATSAEARRPFSMSDVEHVVILMQENRSFDHYFGTMRGVLGFSDPAAIKLPNGKPVFYQPDPNHADGYLLPFHFDTRTTSAQATPGTDHNWGTQHQAFNGGKMDSWIPAKGEFTMGYFTRTDLPFHYALADNFTICDNYFCGVMGPTHPNRLLSLSGTIDPHGENGGPSLDNIGGNYTWKSYPEMLYDAGVTWRYYQDNQDYNMLEFFEPFVTSAPGSPLHDLGMASYPNRFEYDAINDKLPAVSWIATTNFAAEHPGNNPAAGATFIASKLDAIAANPDVWAKTVFILNYDENDGLFDHVPPPVAPPGTPDEYVTKNSPTTVGVGQPVGPGFRVPCIIVSPWTTGGYVCSTPFDHTSVLRFLERFTGVPCPNISAYRRQVLGDMTTAFQGKADDRPPTFGDTNGQLALANYQIANFPRPTVQAVNPAPPVQEPGHRPHIG